MAVKDLLVHIDDSAQSAARLESAIELATAHEAHLTGLYAMAEPHIPGYIRAAIP